MLQSNVQNTQINKMCSCTFHKNCIIQKYYYISKVQFFFCILLQCAIARRFQRIHAVESSDYKSSHPNKHVPMHNTHTYIMALTMNELANYLLCVHEACFQGKCAWYKVCRTKYVATHSPDKCIVLMLSPATLIQLVMTLQNGKSWLIVQNAWCQALLTPPLNYHGQSIFWIVWS